ncbi:hypothetical protein AVEN_217185-1 [Araneus ventricosus]|uniref:Uncharacterized protein n=1 Tax=Araneus ventricosus TaxID=182803 RepID=A0A4Y2KPU4_ARAVE|nr:hypothetical protein AVEN_217185-1 [Araneus ventricosus]
MESDALFTNIQENTKHSPGSKEGCAPSGVLVIAFAFQLYERGFDPWLEGIWSLSQSTTKSYNEPFRYLAERFNPCDGNFCDNPLPLLKTRFPKPFRQAFFAIGEVTGTIALVQISNANRQLTNNDSNSTFNSAQLTGFPASTADETPKSSEAFALQRRSQFTHTVVYLLSS